MWLLCTVGVALAQVPTVEPAPAVERAVRLRTAARVTSLGGPVLVVVGTGLWLGGRWLALDDPGAGGALQTLGLGSIGAALAVTAAAPPLWLAAGDASRQAGARLSNAERTWAIGLYGAGAGLAAVGLVASLIPSLGPGHPLTWSLALAAPVGLASLVVSATYGERGVFQAKRAVMVPWLSPDVQGVAFAWTF